MMDMTGLRDPATVEQIKAYFKNTHKINKVKLSLVASKLLVELPG